MVEFEILENGKLRVKFVGDDQDRQEIKEHLEKHGINSAFANMTEPYWTNGWGVHTGDELNMMTGAMSIAQESTREDDGSLSLFGKVWTNFRNYQVVDEVSEILENGYFDFDFWQEIKD